MPAARCFAVLASFAAICPVSAAAQERLAIRSDVLLYGDNTEFRNEFREGETIFGAAIRVAAVVDLNETVSLSMGAFGNQRFGSDEAFEQVRPVISLTMRGDRSSVVFGTLPPAAVSAPVGPDRGGPHGLRPPFSAKRCRTNARTKRGWHGRSAAPRFATPSGSSGNASTRPITASDSMVV